MYIGGTAISYFVRCKRQAWLKRNGLEMEQESDTVALGRLIDETSYARQPKDFMLEAEFKGISLVAKLDGANLREGILYETKKSPSAEESHLWQLRFYLWVLKLAGKSEWKGVLQYPKRKQIVEVQLLPEHEMRLGEMVEALVALFKAEEPPPRIAQRKFCAKCAFEEFCYG
jgi:CRISPR-associated exonuclease Cas4